MNENADDAESLLHGLKDAPDCFSAQPPEALRVALLASTLAAVRRRSRARRLGQLAVAALAYAAGLATMYAVLSRDDQPAQKPSQAVVAAPQTESTRPQAETPVPRVEVAALSPAELRRMVPGAPRARQIRLLELAGDGYLYGADVEAALDCYRQVLELTPREDLGPPDPQDSWLLAELKLSAAE